MWFARYWLMSWGKSAMCVRPVERGLYTMTKPSEIHFQVLGRPESIPSCDIAYGAAGTGMAGIRP